MERLRHEDRGNVVRIHLITAESPEQLVAGTEWAAQRFYSWGSIGRRLWGSRCGTWWNLSRNIGYKLALDRFGPVGRNPALDPVPPQASGHGACLAG